MKCSGNTYFASACGRTMTKLCPSERKEMNSSFCGALMMAIRMSGKGGSLAFISNVAFATALVSDADGAVLVIPVRAFLFDLDPRRSGDAARAAADIEGPGIAGVLVVLEWP